MLILLAAVVSLPPAFTRLTVLAQGGDGAPADTGDVQPRAEFVRRLSLTANDINYNPADGMLYASVPSSAGATGNSIVPINPATGETGAPVFVGSEPNKLAMSDDGHTLYVSLDGAYAIRRFDTATRTAGQQFPLGQQSFRGNYIANDLAVAPGNPNLLAVARYYPGSSPPAAGVAVFDNGVQRPKTGPDHSEGADFLAFSATESKLYGGGYNYGLRMMTIDDSGVTVQGKTSFFVRARIKFANGLVYSSGGQVVNPDTSTLVGNFSGVATNAFAIDVAAGRAYYLTHETFGGSLVLRAFDLTTFVPAGSATISGITGEPTTMVRWGANGLAFRTNAGKLYLLQTSLIPSSDPIPTPTPVVSPTATPTPVPTFIRQIPLHSNDIIYSAQSQQIYASVPSVAGAKGNSVTRLNPETGEIGPSLFVGSEPSRLALADDGQTMYVALNGAAAVRKLDVSAQTAGIQFSLGNDFNGPLLPDDIAVMPGHPSTVAVSKRSSGSGVSGVTLYDEGVPRAQSLVSSGPVEFASATRLYAGSGFVQRASADQNGLTKLGDVNTFSSGQTQYAGGLLYTPSGKVIDPESGVVKGRFADLNSNAIMMVEPAKNRAFFLTHNFGSSWNLRAYELDTFRLAGSTPVLGISLPYGPGPSSLVRWGTNGLAFTTLPNNFNSSGTTRQIYLVRSALVSNAEAIPSTLQFSAANYNTFERTGTNLVTVTVTRTGGVTGAGTVNYATEGGTATPGADYTHTSGTLSFADGELTKTFTVPILDVNLYEGAAHETIGVTLSGQTGDLVLGSQKTTTITIQDNEGRPSLNPSNLSVPEGQSGITAAQFVVRLSNASVETISIDYATANNSAIAGTDYVAASGTLTFQPGELQKTIPLQINGDTVEEPDERFFVNFSNPVNVNPFNGSGIVNIIDDERALIQFAAPEFTANEGDGRATISVTRFGPTTTSATISYATLDDNRSIRCDDNAASLGAAFARCDYATTFDTLVFAPGEAMKTFTVPLVDDGHVEQREFVNLRLFAPPGVTLGAPSTVALLITDNDTASTPNPADEHAFFVRQHYLDFLSREPDADGLAAWTRVLTGCADAFNTDGDSPSALCDRNVVSSSFFRSAEFELKGYFVYRFYRVAFNRRPSYAEFVTDMRRVTGQTAEEVYAKRRAFSETWALRQEFQTVFGARSNAEFVDSLFGRYGLTAVNTNDPANFDGDAPLVRLTRDELVAALDAQPQRLTRAQVLRAVVQSREVDAAEYNGAFVAMQYYGYLRRAPEEDGYQAWLRVITRGDGYRVMVDGFMNSTEYRLRFGR